MKIIEVENLVKKFGSFVANDHLTFSVGEGEIFGFLGANGAGKTTAMKILCGLSAPTSGKVMVAGYDVYRQSEMIKKRIGYMSQRFSLFEDLSVWENFRFYGGIYGLPKAIINPITRRQFWEIIYETASQGITVFVTTHYMDEAEYCNRVSIMVDGKIVALDTPANLKLKYNAANIEEVFLKIARN